MNNASTPSKPTAQPSQPNGGPGRLASEEGLDDTEDPNDSGGKKTPVQSPGEGVKPGAK